MKWRARRFYTSCTLYLHWMVEFLCKVSWSVSYYSNWKFQESVIKCLIIPRHVYVIYPIMTFQNFLQSSTVCLFFSIRSFSFLLIAFYLYAVDTFLPTYYATYIFSTIDRHLAVLVFISDTNNVVYQPLATVSISTHQ